MSRKENISPKQMLAGLIFFATFSFNFSFDFFHSFFSLFFLRPVASRRQGHKARLLDKGATRASYTCTGVEIT